MPPKYLPYGRQSIDETDIQAVVDVLRSDYLTTGPAVAQFEAQICAFTGARHGVAVSNGTAALHAALHALDITKGDEVIVPAITFVATANAVLYCQGKPVFVDVDAHTLLIDMQAVEAAITPRTKAIIAVDYAGQPCHWDALNAIAKKYNLALVADACHSLGAQYKERNVGTLAHITVFSFHPVKHITTGEGGMAVTNDANLAQKMRIFRGHGITTTAAEREKIDGWHYEMQNLGYNYRITDLQCALGSSQLKKLPSWLEVRNILAHTYATALAQTPIQPLLKSDHVFHAYHLYVIKVENRDICFRGMRKAGIGVNLHYMPVYLHPYYQKAGYKKGLCPVAEKVFTQILTLPLWPGLHVKDIQYIVQKLTSFLP